MQNDDGNVSEYWTCSCGYREPYREMTVREISLYGSHGIPHEHSFVNEKGHTTTVQEFMVRTIAESE